MGRGADEEVRSPRPAPHHPLLAREARPRRPPPRPRHGAPEPRAGDQAHREEGRPAGPLEARGPGVDRQDRREGRARRGRRRDPPDQRRPPPDVSGAGQALQDPLGADGEAGHRSDRERGHHRGQEGRGRDRAGLGRSGPAAHRRLRLPPRHRRSYASRPPRGRRRVRDGARPSLADAGHRREDARHRRPPDHVRRPVRLDGR